jgi:hypothetical protein
MRTALIVAATDVTMSVVSAHPAGAAEGRNFGSDISEDCQFPTFEECRVTVIAGIRGFCNPKVAQRTGESAAAPGRLSLAPNQGPCRGCI